MSTTDERDDGTLKVTRSEGANGDDIVVIPTGPPDETAGRRRRALLIALVVVIALVAITIALVAHNNGSKSVVVRTTTPTTVPGPAAGAVKPKASPKITTPAPTVAVIAPRPTAVVTTPSSRPRNTGGTTKVVTPPPTVPAPTLPPPPKQYGASVLTWSAPRAMTIASGTTGTLAVTAHNPTDGIVTLSHPLSCAPRLDHSEVCSQNVQPIGSGQSASARYTIDAHGVAAGHYTITIEAALTVTVAVT